MNTTEGCLSQQCGNPKYRYVAEVLASLLAFFMVYGFQMLKLGLLEDDIADLCSPSMGCM